MVYVNRVLGAPGLMNEMLQTENGQKVDILNRYISIITDFDGKGFVIFEHTINHLSFGYVGSPQLEYFFFFFLFSFFFLRLSTFKLLNALYSKFERLKISGRTGV